MLEDERGRTVYLADLFSRGTESNDICFVAIGVSDLRRVTNRRHCTDESSLIGHPSSQIESRNLTIKTSGVLRYSVTVSAKTKAEVNFDVDTATLTAFKIPIKSITGDETENGPSALLVPWRVESEQNIAPGNRIDLDSPTFVNRENDLIGLDLLISDLGRVIRATASGSTKEVRQALEASAGAWSFRPTILDGRSTRVQVRFEGSLKDLAK